MIRRINEWIKRYSRSATLIILLPIFFIVFLVEEDYFLAVIFFAGWFFLVRNLVVYVKTDEKETKNYIMESVEIDENGRKLKMAMKSKKVWFQISWMWKLFPFCLLMIIYCIVTCEEDYLDYALHNDDYRIVEGEIIEVYEKVYSHYRQKNYMYFSKVVIQGQGNDVIELTADMEDYVGKKISVAVNIDNPDKIQRTEWIVFRSNKQIMLWFFFLCGVFLIVGKIISYFMIRRLSIEGETMDKNAIWINESRSKDGRSGRILDVMSDGIKVVAYGIITIISIHSEEYIVACVFGGFTILCLWMLCYGKR